MQLGILAMFASGCLSGRLNGSLSSGPYIVTIGILRIAEPPLAAKICSTKQTCFQ